MIQLSIAPLSSSNENVSDSFYTNNVRNGKNLFFAGGSEGHENLYDCFAVGTKNDFYGCISAGWDSEHLYCCLGTNGYNLYYSYLLEYCSFCIGCIGLKNKSFCILNKQYTKEEWYELADKIFAQMDEQGILGDFFPGNLNPFYFNDTAASLIDPTFTKEEVEAEGYLWRDAPIKVDISDTAKIIEVKDLDQYQWYDSDGHWQISKEILEKVIRDEHGDFYRIVPMELEFLRKHALPLPTLHWLERIKMGFRM